MELPYRSSGGSGGGGDPEGHDQHTTDEEIEQKEDVSADNRLYNGYQGSLMESSDDNVSQDISADAINSATNHRALQFSIILCFTLVIQ